MNEVLREAFRHGAWATRTVVGACRNLSAEQLRRPAACPFGSILATLNHVVLSDAGYATILTGVRPAWATDTDDLAAIEARAEETARVWERLLAGPLDAERRLVLDAGEYECPASVVVAQALQHASAHREQIRAALKGFGVPPPDLQPWAYADETGRARWLRRKKPV